jgi:hypothetical protein
MANVVVGASIRRLQIKNQNLQGCETIPVAGTR